MQPTRRPSDPHSPRDYAHNPQRVRERDSRQSPKRPRHDSLSPPVGSTAAQGGTALPSIHQLHPDLPPPGHQHQPAQSPFAASEYPPSASYGSHPSMPPHFYGAGPASGVPPVNPHLLEDRKFLDRHLQGPSALSSASMHEQAMSAGADSDQDQGDGDQTGPPKKKRRRQALSCTECKRRKIKCDRAQPCGPCARRGEPNKCHWHVVEPIEKYVTRTEWEDLHARYRQVEDRCLRLEHLIVQLHPEIAVGHLFEVGGTPSGMAASSPGAPRPTALRSFSLAGPGISGAAYQRATPNQPFAALGSPSAVPTAPAASGMTTSSNPAAGGDLHSMGAATGGLGPHQQPPPPSIGSARSTSQSPRIHSSQFTDRRTSASGLHGLLSTASERPLLHHQVPGRSPPLLHQQSLHPGHSYAFPPPSTQVPSPRTNTSSSFSRSPPASVTLGLASPRKSSSSGSLPEVSGMRPPTQSASHATLSGAHQTRKNPLALSNIVGAESVAVIAATSPAMTHASAQQPSQVVPGTQRQQRRSQSEHRPQPPPQQQSTTQDPMSKNSLAQTSDEAGDRLRHRPVLYLPQLEYLSSQASPSYHSDSSGSHRRSLSFPRTHSAGSDSLDSPDADVEMVSPSTPHAKRARRTSLYLSLSSAVSNPATPPPALAIH